ncbi:nicotinamide riboside transporter PnuC [Ekhidna sp.]|uniref:nicotinamide riboside transporter PnuC n=1 Tax=Ekhidna sp. TaxID=2608089 RepID=UPI0035175ED2
MSLFDIENIAFTILGYDLSYIELIGTLFGFISVILAARANILTWPTGIINEVAFFILFYQVQLYSDMYLQVYFFGVTIYGWYYWKNQNGSRSITNLSKKWRFRILLILVITTLMSGYLISKVHLYFSEIFSQPASYPYWDALTTMSSIVATVLLSRKIIETWVLWIIVDIISVVLYLLKGIHLVAIEYFIFLIICVVGLRNWRNKL